VQFTTPLQTPAAALLVQANEILSTDPATPLVLDLVLPPTTTHVTLAWVFVSGTDVVVSYDLVGDQSHLTYSAGGGAGGQNPVTVAVNLAVDQSLTLTLTPSFNSTPPTTDTIRLTVAAVLA